MSTETARAIQGTWVILYYGEWLEGFLGVWVTLKALELSGILSSSKLSVKGRGDEGKRGLNHF